MQEDLYSRITDHAQLMIVILAIAFLVSACPGYSKSKTRPIHIQQPPSHVTIRPAEPEEEFDVIWRALTQFSLYHNYNDELTLPNHEIFKEIIKIHPFLREAEKTKARNIFIRRLYRSAAYENGLKSFAAIEKKLIPVFSRFVELNKQWGFKIYPYYEVLLSLYGPATQFNPQSGKIILKTDKNGKFERQTAVNSLVEQMIHLGLHEAIVEKYKLSRRETERLVDLICSLYFEDILKDYKIQTADDKRLDAVITEKSIPHLAKAVKTYRQKYPRESEYGNLLETSGVDVIVIEKILPETQASKVGLKSGDIIVLYDQKRLKKPQELVAAVKKKQARDNLELVVIRNGMMIRFTLRGGPIGIQIRKMSILNQG